MPNWQQKKTYDRFIQINTAPTAPATGMVVYADGSGWDPGNGQGFYFYDGTSWERLGIDLGNATYGWRDELAAFSSAKLPAANFPTLQNFGAAGSLQRKEYVFAVNDYVYIKPIHIQHDVKPNSLAYFHVHWTTDGTDTNTVVWELNYQRSKGHNQAAFGAPTQLLLPAQAASGTAYQHMIVEDTVGVTLYEPDELFLVSVRRVTNGGTDNTDNVFGLMCDMHYQSDRMATKNKAPNFYT